MLLGGGGGGGFQREPSKIENEKSMVDRGEINFDEGNCKQNLTKGIDGQINSTALSLSRDELFISCDMKAGDMETDGIRLSAVA